MSNPGYAAVKRWRERNPGYHAAMQRKYRAQGKRHLCPGAGGYTCMVLTTRIFCRFCERTLALAAGETA